MITLSSGQIIPLVDCNPAQLFKWAAVLKIQLERRYLKMAPFALIHYSKFRKKDNLEEMRSQLITYITRFTKSNKRSYNARFKEIYTKYNVHKTKLKNLRNTVRCKDKYTTQKANKL